MVVMWPWAMRVALIAVHKVLVNPSPPRIIMGICKATSRGCVNDVRALANEYS